MTIRELAERTGMTVRNIRAHQTRGLLPPPVVRGRTGYYNEEHVARITLTQEMQADGLNLEAIRRVLDSADGSASAIFDFTRALRVPFEEEAPEIIDVEELSKIWGEEANPKTFGAPRSSASSAPCQTAGSRSSARGSYRPRPSWPSLASVPGAPWPPPKSCVVTPMSL